MAINLIELNARQMVHIFKGRTDRCVVYSKGKEVAVATKRGEYELLNRMEEHVTGQVRCAFYNMQDDNTVSWAVINFNEKGPSEDVKADSLLLVRELRKLGFRSVRRERTMHPEEEYNVWFFLRPTVPAKKVRHFIHLVIDKLGLPRKTPIIPTVEMLPPGSFGQHVWVPYFNGIDKWLDDQGNSYVCQGLKSDQSVFIDDEGNTIEHFILEIPFNDEGDVDRAIVALEGELSDHYVRGIGLPVQETAFEKLLEGCVAYRAMVDKIENDGILDIEGQVRIGSLLRGLGLEKLMQTLLEKIQDYNPARFEKALAKYNGQIFPACSDLKTAGFCPANKECFMVRVPLTERLGFWESDKGGKATIEPNVSPYVFKAIGQQEKPRTGDEDPDDEFLGDPAAVAMASQGVAPVKIEVIPASKFAREFAEGLEGAGERASALAVTGFNPGLDILNEAIDGLIPGMLICLSGSPGAGKTTLARQVLDTVADREKVPCLYITYDLDVFTLHRKSISRLAGIPAIQLLAGKLSPEEKAKVDKVNGYFQETLGELIHVMEGDQRSGIPQLEKALEQTKARFAVIDFIQGIPVGTNISTLDPDERATRILNNIKQLARKYNVCIMAVSNGPMTRGIMYGPDQVLQLYSQSKPESASSDRQPLPAILNVEKNRHGKSLVSIQLTYFPPRNVFYGEKRIEYRPIKG